MPQNPQIRFLRDRHEHSIAYAEHGTGPLVICPAWWVSHVEKDWSHEPFREFFDALGRGLRIVRYDRPGVGLSDRSVRGRTLDDEVDLLSDIADALDEPTYALFAISCAGPISLRHTARHPERVSKLCLYGTYLNGNDICSRSVQEAVRALVRAHWGMGARAVADIFFPDATRDELDAFARQTRDAATSEVADELLALTYKMSAAEIAHDLKTQCLVIHREGDRAIPFEAGRHLASRLKNAQLVTLPGRAHPPWMDGLEIARIANAFFTGTEPRAEKPDTNDEPNAACRFNEINRCVLCEGKTVALTPLEFGVLKELTSAQRSVVTRDALLEAVWGQKYEGSNKIDAVISALRKKLGAWAPSIETVTGHGYRFTKWRKKETAR